MLIFYRMLRIVTSFASLKDMSMFESLWYMGTFISLLTIKGEVQ